MLCLLKEVENKSILSTMKAHWEGIKRKLKKRCWKETVIADFNNLIIVTQLPADYLMGVHVL